MDSRSYGWLACCHGYAVAAGGRRVGIVETPVFAAGAREPDYLIVRTSSEISGTFRTVPAALVEGLDLGGTITLAVSSDAVAELPEHLPLERH